jgi:hypothetical protein
MSTLLAFALRHRFSRRVLARFRRPTPADLDRLSQGQIHAYLDAIGAIAEAEAVRAAYRRDRGPEEAE